MPGLVPGIHVFTTLPAIATWMASELGLARVPRYWLPQVGYTRLAVTSPAMTTRKKATCLDVRQDSDREPRRDRIARAARLQGARHRDRRRAFDRRRGRH